MEKKLYLLTSNSMPNLITLAESEEKAKEWLKKGMRNPHVLESWMGHSLVIEELTLDHMKKFVQESGGEGVSFCENTHF